MTLRRAERAMRKSLSVVPDCVDRNAIFLAFLDGRLPDHKTRRNSSHPLASLCPAMFSALAPTSSTCHMLSPTDEHRHSQMLSRAAFLALFLMFQHDVIAKQIEIDGPAG